MAIQSNIDDSGTKGTGRLLVLAGLVGPAETLAVITEEWDRELASHVPGRIRYFKADEARSCSKQFMYWSKDSRDQKVSKLAAVIDRDDVMMLLSVVDLYAHAQMERFLGGPLVDAKHHPFNQPYMLALYGMLFAAGMEARRRNPLEKCEIIFDDHPKFRAIVLKQYPTLLEALPEPVRAVMPLQPYFRDDEDWVLLQCADMLAGLSRTTGERDPKRLQVDFARLRVSPFSIIFDHKRLKDITEARIKLPLTVTEIKPFTLPIGGSGIVPVPPLAYFDVDQPIVCSASRESLPKEVQRWVMWDR